MPSGCTHDSVSLLATASRTQAEQPRPLPLRGGELGDPEVQVVQRARHVATLDLGVELAHSHSMVPGGFEVMSRVTRLTSATSLVMRVEMRSITS